MANIYILQWTVIRINRTTHDTGITDSFCCTPQSALSGKKSLQRTISTIRLIASLVCITSNTPSYEGIKVKRSLVRRCHRGNPRCFRRHVVALGILSARVYTPLATDVTRCTPINAARAHEIPARRSCANPSHSSRLSSLYRRSQDELPFCTTATFYELFSRYCCFMLFQLIVQLFLSVLISSKIITFDNVCIFFPFRRIARKSI